MGDDVRALLFGDEEPKKSSSSSLWGHSADEADDLFSESRSPMFQPSSKRISDVLREIDSQRSAAPVAPSVHSKSLDSIFMPSMAVEKEDVSHEVPESNEKFEETEQNDVDDLNDPLLNPLSVSTVEISQTSQDPEHSVPKPSVDSTNEEKITKARLFETFIVVGTPLRKRVSPNIVTKPLEPQVLFKYPKKSQLPLQQVFFSFCNSILQMLISLCETDSRVFFSRWN